MSVEWIEVKYVNMLSPRLRNFKRQPHNVFNFSCPYCGDSKKSKSKARGYIMISNGANKRSNYYCHNCSISISFDKFLEQQDNGLYQQYVEESITEKYSSKPLIKQPDPALADVIQFANKMKRDKFRDDDRWKNIPKISQLDPNHPAAVFVKARLIPNKYHAKLFYVEKFFQWANLMIEDPTRQYNINQVREHPRIVIPIIDNSKQLIGFQARSIRNRDNAIKYLTTTLSDQHPLIYGLDTVNITSPDQSIYVFEGPIDSMFIDNSIASCGGVLTSKLDDLMYKYPHRYDKQQFVVVYDNEPRNKATVHRIQTAIDQGFRVCIWPDSIKEKDINLMVLTRSRDYSEVGCASFDVRQIIDDNTYQGLAATMQLNQWKKC